MKKIFSLLLSMVMILSITAYPSFAQSNVQADGSVQFGISSVEAVPGSDVTVDFTVTGEYEAHGLTAYVNYDATKLSITENGFTQGEVWTEITSNGGFVISDASATAGCIPFMAIMPSSGLTANGTIFSVTFHISDSVELGTQIPLTIEIAEFYYMPISAQEPEPIPVTLQNGTIKVQVYHEVTFKDWDGRVLKTETVEHGNAATPPEDPTRDGYNFVGWDKDFANVIEDMTITALYSINSYTITYKINGEIYTTQTYEYGQQVTAPSYDVPEHYIFSGWQIPETMPAEDLELDATLTIESYTVTFVDGITGEVIDTQTVEYGSDAVLPEAPTHTGYIFERWDGEYNNITGECSITALYWQIGDVNHDGQITTADVLHIMRYGLGIEDEGNETIMDFNGDGVINSIDALLVLRLALGL